MQIEHSVLSSLTTPEAVAQAFNSGLSPEHFENTKLTRPIFSFIVQYWMDSGRKLAPTIEVLTEEYPSYKAVDPEESLPWLISKIKERFRRNKIQGINERTAELVQSGDDKEALKVLLTEGFALSQSLTDRRSVSDLGDPESVLSRRARYSERARFEGGIKGAPMGFNEIDSHFYGILPGELACISGYSGTGKSFALGHSAIEADKAGFRPYIATLEIPKEDFEDRLDCLASGLPYTKLLEGTLDKDEICALHDAQDSIGANGSIIVDSPPQGERSVAHLVNKALQAGCNYLLIDQLSFIEPRDRRKTLRETYGEIMNDLKVGISSDSEKLALLMAVQSNRDQKKNEGRSRGNTTNLSEAVFIEQYSDHVFGLTQTNEARLNQAMFFDILKCRRQGPKSWMLRWELRDRTHLAVDQEVAAE